MKTTDKDTKTELTEEQLEKVSGGWVQDDQGQYWSNSDAVQYGENSIIQSYEGNRGKNNHAPPHRGGHKHK